MTIRPLWLLVKWQLDCLVKLRLDCCYLAQWIVSQLLFSLDLATFIAIAGSLATFFRDMVEEKANALTPTAPTPSPKVGVVSGHS